MLDCKRRRPLSTKSKSKHSLLMKRIGMKVAAAAVSRRGTNDFVQRFVDNVDRKSCIIWNNRDNELAGTRCFNSFAQSARQRILEQK